MFEIEPEQLSCFDETQTIVSELSDGKSCQIKNFKSVEEINEKTFKELSKLTLDKLKDKCKIVGFQINSKDGGVNPVYEVYFSDSTTPTHCFSKVYNDNFNPSSNFAAIMTCGDAEENCPFIPGVELRIATTYNDPKAFDGTSQAAEKYKERCLQIALETLYVFSKVQ